MLHLYKRLFKESLLKRSVSCLIQNQVESFNASIWRKCSKELYYKTAAVASAVAMSVLTGNAGCQGFVHVFKNSIARQCFYKKSTGFEREKRLTAS